MTTGPFAVRSDSLTGLPSVPFSAKSGAFCPTSSATAALARIRTARALRTRHRLTARVLGIAPPWALTGKLPASTAGSARSAGISLIRRHFLTRIERPRGERLRGDGWLAGLIGGPRRGRRVSGGLVAAETNHGVAESRDLALPHPALVLPLILGDALTLDSPLTLPSLQHHLDAADPSQLAPEILIEGGFVLTDHEQEPDPGERPGWQAVEQPEGMAPADTMSFGRVVERRPFTETRRLALALTPGAHDPHDAGLAGLARSRGRMG